MHGKLLILAAALSAVVVLLPLRVDADGVSTVRHTQVSPDSLERDLWHRPWWPGFRWSGYNLRPYFGASPLFGESFVRNLPAVRYNRVEGFVLGMSLPRLGPGWFGETRIFGHGGYAFALDQWRGSGALERTLRASDHVQLLAGAGIHRTTETNDAWKISENENSLGAFFFEYDFLDYYEIEGWTAWTALRIGSYTEFALAYREDEYRSLTRQTGWSMFAGDGFRENPFVDEGTMRSFLLALEAGRVGGLYSLPNGWAVQALIESSHGLESDWDFYAATIDARWYYSPGYRVGWAFRTRFRMVSDEAPVQKLNTIGGLGTVRAWSQNGLRGREMALFNAEFLVDDVDTGIGRYQLFAFADGAWTNVSGGSFLSGDGTIGAIGGGIGFDQRRARLELAIPVSQDDGFGEPWLWFRLFPAF